MNSMTLDASYSTQESDRFWLAIVISLLLHAGLYYGLPYWRNETPPPLERIEITLNTAMQPPAAPMAPTPPPASEPVPELPPPKPVIKPEPQPTKKEKPVEKPPVLATEAPEAPDDYVVPAVPEPEVTAPEVTEPDVAAPEAPAPAPEPTPPVSAAPSPATTAPSAPSTPAVTSTQPAEATAAEAWNGYGQLLYNLVGRNKNYPQIAVRRNWEGEVKIYARFMLGKLVEASIVTSSGHEVLDKEALDMVRKAANQLPVGGELARKSFTVTIPVAFKLFS